MTTIATPTAYKNQLKNIKDSLETILVQSPPSNNDVESKILELTRLNREVLGSIGLLNTNMTSIQSDLNDERTKNKRLKKALVIAERNYSTTDEMISDYEMLYEKGYLRNWALGISICAGLYGIYVLYKAKPTA